MRKINVWTSSNEMWATLKTGKELLIETDNVLKELVEDVVESLKSLEYDELVDWLETSSTKELIMFSKYFKSDDRLRRITEIEINKR